MLLIHPPLVKPCEAPAGLAKLAGAMNHHKIPYTIIDANREGILSLLGKERAERGYYEKESREGDSQALVDFKNTWTVRSLRHVQKNITALKTRGTYTNIDRYTRAVMDINRVLDVSASHYDVRLSLANYIDRNLSPVRSADLIKASERSDRNPFYPYFKTRLLNVLKQKEPSIVGFSLNYLSQALCTFAMIGFIKEECPGVKIILGGGLATSWARRPGWGNPFRGLVDHIVAGPGELPLLSLYKISHQEEYNIPDYESLPMADYFAPGTVLPYSASSGCYWSRCSFCPERAEGNPFHPIPAGRVTSELRALTEKTKPALVHLLDNALSPALLKAIAESPFNIPWYGFARISSQLANLDFCVALKRSGCVMLQLGLESGDQDVLDHMGKGFDLETASCALKSLKKAGIVTFVYLLFGTPPEIYSKALKTLDFTVKHSSLINFLNLAVFNLPAYGPESEKLDTREFYEGDLFLYRNFSHPGGWNRSVVRQFLNREFKRHPAIAAILKKTPPAFTSNHAPFFIM
ncbi:MAG: radical SAM protein [Syntrophaceae bacterium]